MNTRLLLCFVLALLAGCRSPASRRKAPDPAETKVRLYAEALTARDEGDLVTAKARLQSLLEISPNDAGVQRLLAGVEAALAAPPPPSPPPPSMTLAPVDPVPEVRAAPVASAPARTVAVAPPSVVIPAAPSVRPEPSPASGAGAMPTVIEEPAPNAVPRTPPDSRTQALVRVEAIGAALAAAPEGARTERLMAYIQAQRSLAEEYAKEGNFVIAVGTLDAALAAIRISTEELRDERAKYIQAEVKARQGARLRHKR